ncbi:Amastin surface glycoprotein [Trypanosoma melophagium]|uniref:Amastin surface glycoprotein n=1 Tax=Trypanosoma melophagium TaxID=715481 RepID=UPI00351A9ECD|nr:Amastin surface glycoprotein [Trypanosoma melophagium]
MSEKEDVDSNKKSNSNNKDDDPPHETHIPLQQESPVRPHETHIEDQQQREQKGQIPPTTSVRPTQLPSIQFGGARKTTNSPSTTTTTTTLSNPNPKYVNPNSETSIKAAKPGKLGFFDDINTSSENSESRSEVQKPVRREVPMALVEKTPKDSVANAAMSATRARIGTVESPPPPTGIIADPKFSTTSVDVDSGKRSSVDHSRDMRELAAMMAAQVREEQQKQQKEQPVAIAIATRGTMPSHSSRHSSSTWSSTAKPEDSPRSPPHVNNTADAHEERRPHRGDVYDDDDDDDDDDGAVNVNNNKNKQNIDGNRKKEEKEHSDSHYYDDLKIFKLFITCVDKVWNSAEQMDTGVLVMLLTTILAFVLTVVSSPLSQVDVTGGECYTYWGYKEDCDSTIYTNRTAFINCAPIKARLNVGAAFSSMALILIFAALGCIIVLVKNSDLRLLRIIILGLFGTIFFFQLIAWAVIAGIYSSRYCEDTTLPRTTAYGVGFGMQLTSWFLIIIDIALSTLFFVR